MLGAGGLVVWLSQLNVHLMLKDLDNDGSECIYVSICGLLKTVEYPISRWLGQEICQQRHGS